MLEAMSKSGSNSWPQNRKDRMVKTAKLISMALVTALVAGIFVAIVGLLWFDGPSPIFAQTDTSAPTISSVAITSDTGDDEVYLDDDGVYGIGDKIEVTVTFSEYVTVTGSPQLELTIGAGAKNAAYKSTTDNKVVFSYTVAVRDSDTDGVSIGASKLSLNGGSIKDAADNAADLSHDALAAQEDHRVDGIRPTISNAHFVSSTGGTDGAYTAGEILVAGVEFNEDVIATGGPQMELDFEGAAKVADFGYAIPKCEETICFFPLWGRRGIHLQFEYTVLEGDLDSDGVAVGANAVSLNGGTIQDAAGNDAVLTHGAVAANSNFIVDAVLPTVSSIAITSDPGEDDTYGTGDKIEVTVTFSENVRVPEVSRSDVPGNHKPQLELDVGGEARTPSTRAPKARGSSLLTPCRVATLTKTASPSTPTSCR